MTLIKNISFVRRHGARAAADICQSVAHVVAHYGMTSEAERLSASATEIVSVCTADRKSVNRKSLMESERRLYKDVKALVLVLEARATDSNPHQQCLDVAAPWLALFAEDSDVGTTILSRLSSIRSLELSEVAARLLVEVESDCAAWMREHRIKQRRKEEISGIAKSREIRQTMDDELSNIIILVQADYIAGKAGASQAIESINDIFAKAKENYLSNKQRIAEKKKNSTQNKEH